MDNTKQKGADHLEMEAKIILEQNLAKILDHNQFCSFATVEGNRPKQRYMALYNQGLSIHLVTDRKTHKVEELEGNPHVSLLLGYEIGGSREVVEIEGTCKVTAEDSLRKQIWKEEFKKQFTGPDDPDYVLLEITPVRVEYTGKDGEKHEWIE
ncbi:pyridoxamine 5'-phosphate oxidase family protein [Paenibacillus favisporus]|uniref:pyridoxamine 5'-phosphate oxidase family protein n=1 Tax=Paenibacillus TaxID=44249 RepID=UPI0021B17CA2|nr:MULTISPECIES: pyridoxamine 5'-phosphate oxidase family protein [Paenibacillus]MEC0178805.1 pyridoxamine 5'-phosphate oxidase family protein [Paenibacillus favisporus]